MKKLLLTIIELLMTFYSVLGQKSYWGGSVGVSIALGTHVNRVGISLSAYYNYKFTQVNATARGFYNFSTLALNQSTPELQLALGTQFGYNKTDTISNDFIGIIENNMPYKNSVGYAYTHYIDGQKTSQGTGIIAFNIDRVTIASENDLFAGGDGYRDRYRTGALYVGYQHLDTKVGINMTLWTGDYTGSKKVTESDYPARFGYLSDDVNSYGKFSAGLLSLQIKQLLPYQQIAQANIGVDSEHVRHTIQNKLMHDLPFLPRKWMHTEQLHVPMLTKEGEQYLYLPEQKVKPISYYLRLGMNSGLFY
ncbi:MAG: hypothetical protein J5I47_12695 [Vicingus serpentipes]|nr:hypothetical protein [Vicingus serpentipes]